MPIRETGSILVRAPRERVFSLLRERLAREPGLVSVQAERLETRRSLFILRDERAGTRVIHARTANGFAFSPKPREELRRKVEQELLLVHRLVEVDAPLP